MGKNKPLNAKAALPFKVGNKLKRRDLQKNRKKALDIQRRDERFQRKRDEDRNPELRRERLARNVPVTIDRKRVWDDVDGDGLGVSVDVEQLKRRRIEAAEAAEREAAENSEEDHDDDADSMLDSDEDEQDEDEEDEESRKAAKSKRSASIAASTTSTNLDLTPDSLALKFPTLFTDTPPPAPKILLTTSINSTLHSEARLLCTLFRRWTFQSRIFYIGLSHGSRRLLGEWEFIYLEQSLEAASWTSFNSRDIPTGRKMLIVV